MLHLEPKRGDGFMHARCRHTYTHVTLRRGPSLLQAFLLLAVLPALLTPTAFALRHAATVVQLSRSEETRSTSARALRQETRVLAEANTGYASVSSSGGLAGIKAGSSTSSDISSEEQQASIPHILHQSWKTEELPAKVLPYRQSWMDQNPGWEFKLWTDEENRQLVYDHYPELLQHYDGLLHPIMRADFVRYLYMYHYGGVYADLDMECLKPIAGLLLNHTVILGRMGTNDSFPHSIPNAFMASVPRHPFWKFCIVKSTMRHMGQLVTINGSWWGPESVTGPLVLKHSVRTWHQYQLTQDPLLKSNRLTILPDGVIYPVNWRDILDVAENISDAATAASVAWMNSCLESGKTFDRKKCKEEVNINVPWAHTVTYWSHSWGEEQEAAEKAKLQARLQARRRQAEHRA